MSYLEQQMKFLKFDKRLMDIYLKDGSLTEQEYKEYLTTLDDCSHKSESWSLGSDRNVQKSSPEPVNQESFPEAAGDTGDASHSPQNGPENDAADPSINRDPLGSGY